MSEVGDSRRIPHFLVAGGPKGLQRLMLLNNMNNGMQYSYFDIQNVGGKWYAWYLRKANIVIPSGKLTENVGV